MIGLFGGTFDPIHFGHLRPALEVTQALGLEQMRFIPLAVAVHRDQPAAAAAQRLAMVRTAVSDQQGFFVDDREICRSGRSYTYDTLTECHREQPDTTWCLCVGGDAFNEFLTWHRPLDILELAHVVVMQRPGAQLPDDPVLSSLCRERSCNEYSELRSTRAGHILFFPVTQLDISATAIRSQIASGSNPRFLLPEPVLQIIQLERLYR